MRTGRQVLPRRKLNPYTPSPLEEIGEGVHLAGTTYLWGAILRVDVLEAPVTTRVSFIGPQVKPIASLLATSG
jgi:hypothetical protein